MVIPLVLFQIFDTARGISAELCDNLLFFCLASFVAYSRTCLISAPLQKILTIHCILAIPNVLYIPDSRCDWWNTRRSPWAHQPHC